MKNAPARFIRFALLLLVAPAHKGSAAPSPAQALTFHASFDWGADADYSRGDGAVYHAESIEQRGGAAKGLPPGTAVQVMKQGGRYEGALKFDSGVTPIVFYQARNNLAGPKPGWQGTFSFWLKTDPKDLTAARWVPFMAGARDKDDAAFFVEFERQNPAAILRAGACPDKAGQGAPAGALPEIIVRQPPFSSQQWTHVAIVFQKFNTDKPEGSVTLYLNGRHAGFVGSRIQTFTWKGDGGALIPGMGFTGWMDDFAVFDRALTGPEITDILKLKNGIGELHAERIRGVPPEVLRLAKKGWQLYRAGEFDGEKTGPLALRTKKTHYTSPTGVAGSRMFESNGVTASFDRDNSGHFETIFLIRCGKLIYVGTLTGSTFSHVSAEFSHLKGKPATNFDRERSYE